MTRRLPCIAAVAVLASCWTETEERPLLRVSSSPRAGSGSGTQCEPLSREAGLAPSDGGYRRLGQVARDSLRAAIVDAARKQFGPHAVVVRGRAFAALAAAVHDLRSELVACMHAADPGVQSLRYAVRLTMTGDRSVGAMVGDVSVKRVVSVPDQPSTEVSTSAEACFADILTSIELPPSDGPGYFDTQVSVDDPCVAARK